MDVSDIDALTIRLNLSRMSIKYVAYYRVSTTHQGIDGLGMDAQCDAVQKFLAGGDRILICDFSEVESGKVKNRPELHARIVQI